MITEIISIVLFVYGAIMCSITVVIFLCVSIDFLL